MKKKFLSLLFLSTFAISLTAQNLFLYENNNFEQIQRTAEKPNRPGNPTNSSNDAENNTLAGIFFEILFDICDQIWIFSHMNADYDIAPYATRPKYIDYKAEDWQAEKFYRYTLETGTFFFLQDLTIGNESRIEGITYKFFGPVFENTLFTSFRSMSENSNIWLIGNLRLGAINLVNFNLFNVALNIQWTHWYGQKIIDGMNLGFILRSYPIKPVLLEWRVNWQSFMTEENYNDFSAYFESHLELGIMVDKRIEIYAAWKYVNDRFNENIKNGVSSGVKFHF